MPKAKRRTILQDRSALSDWKTLNEVLRNLTRAEDVANLLRMEQRNSGRVTFMQRIHARLNRLRAREERAALK